MTLTVPVNEIVEANSNGLLGKHPSWERVRLGDVAVVQNGAAFKSGFFNDEGRGMPLLRIRDVLGDRTVAYYDGPFDDELIVEPGDLVIGMDGDFNSALWRGPRALLNQRVCRLKFQSDALSPRFVHYVLPGYLAAVNEVTSSVTVKHLSSKTVADLALPCPTPDEQERIVALLDARVAELGRGLGELSRAEVGIDLFRVAILAAVVSGKLGPSEGRGSAEASIEAVLAERRSHWEESQLEVFRARGKVPSDDAWKQKYKEPAAPTPWPGIELPDSWAWASVDQLALEVQYGSSAKTSEDPTGIPVLRMGNLLGGRLDTEQLKFLPADHQEFPGLYLNEGDVLFNRTNSPELVGKAAVYKGDPGPCSFASYLIRVRLSRHYRPELLVYFLSSGLGRAWVRAVVSQQVGQANVNGTKLKHLTVPVPPVEAQAEICRLAEAQLLAISETVRTIAQARIEAEVLRKAILRRAVRGELVNEIAA